MQYYIYILKLTNGTNYTGYTSDLETRITQHRLGLVKSTKNRFLCLIHFEIYKNKKEAMLREKWLKSGIGRSWIKDNVNGEVAKLVTALV